MNKIYGNQCGSDNAFTRKARLLQSMYRVEIGEEEGTGPTRASKRKYGNMISGGEVSGKNFLMKETFEYAKERVANKRENETIDGFRLFNNLLSSQPMAFNLFHPLMLLLKQDPAMVTLAVRSVFRNFPVFEVTEIGLEFIPTPIDKYTNDKSAMDAYIRFVDNKGGKHIIAIETKSTHIPLTTKEDKIRNSEGKIIADIQKLGDGLPKNSKQDDGYVYPFEDAYVKTEWGDIKIKEVKFEYENHTEIKQFKIDAQNITKAILKNAINKEVLFVGKNFKDLFK